MIAATVFFLFAFGLALWYTVARVGARPSITLLLLGGLLVIHGAPMLIYMNLTGPDTLIYEIVLSSVDPEEVLPRVLWAMGYVYLGVVAGVSCARAVAKEWEGGWWHGQMQADWSQPLRQNYELGPLHVIALWLVAAGIVAVILLEGQPGKIASYFLSASTEADQLMARVEGGGTGLYAYNVFLYSVAPLVVMVVWCARHFEPARFGLTLLLVTLTGLVLLGKLGTLSKAPPVIFILQLAFLVAIVARTKLRLRELFPLGLLVLLLFSFVVALTFPELEWDAVLAFLHYRGFDIPNEGLIEYFAAFPAYLPHNWEYGVFGSLQRPPAEALLPNYFAVAELSRGSILSSSNVMFLGDAWADWGWVGVLSFPFAAGFLVQGVDLYASRHGRTDEWACITAACSFSVFTMLSTALSTALLTGGLLLIPFVSWLFVKSGSGSDEGATANSNTHP